MQQVRNMQREQMCSMQMQIQKKVQKRNRIFTVMAWMLTILTILATLPMKPAQAAKTAKGTYSWGTLWSDGSLTLKNTSAGYADVDAIKGYDKKSEVIKISCESGTKFPEKCNALFMDYENVEIIDLGNGDFSEVKNYNYMFVKLNRITTLTLPASYKGVTAFTALSNFDKGWACDDEEGSRISGDGTYAEFTNTGKHTYYRIRDAITGTFTYGGKLQYDRTAAIRCSVSNCAFENRKYEWYREGVLVTGATGNTYKFTREDIGKSFVCYVSDKTLALKGRIKVELGTVTKQVNSEAPQNLISVRPSRTGASDGKITGVNTTMEYRKTGETVWKKCTGTAITGLSAGTYAVRYAETDTRYASDAQTVTVQEGPAKLILDSNGKLTIYGKVQRNDYLNFEEKNKVTSVVAADNAVLPQDCSKIFQYYEKCVSIDLSKTNTANVTNMSYMFDDCKALKSLNLSKFNTANVTDMSYMFSDCSALTSLNVSAFNTYNVTNMRHMFDGCCLLTSLDVSNFNTAKVTDMSYMFENCCALTSLDLSGFSTAKVTDMNSMFDKCKALTSVDVSKFNTAKVTDMSHMFSWCESLESVDVSKFNTSNVTKMSYMFFACNHMTRLDLSSFSINDETDINEMFSASRHIRYLTLGSGIKKIDEKYKLDNGDSGWYCGNEANLISGGGNYAVITNSGKNTYSKVIYLGGNLYIRNVDRPTFGDDIIYGETIKAVPSLQWYMCPEENLAYQWQRDGVNISGATANTYTLVKGDIGKIISCVVTDKTGETPGSIKASTKYAVGKKSGPGSPEGLTAFATSIRGAADGRITGVTSEMEYATNINFRDAKPCTGNVITGLKANMYYIRYAETATTKAGGVTVLQVKEGPASAPTPTAAPDKPATEVFSDIKPTAWYVKAVQYVYEKGIMSGKGSEFQPGMPVTREEFAQTLYNHFGKPQPSVFTGNPFPDVKSGKWYTNAVLWAKEKDIVKGYSNGKFGVGDKITREQLAQMLYKYARIYGYDLSLTAGASTGYKDSNKRSDWAYTALDWAVSQGIISGKGTSGAPKSQLLLDPKGNATRAECAQMMMKLLQNNQ